MSKKKYTLFLFSLISLLMAGCAATPTAEPTSEESAPAPKVASIVETDDENHCLNCHADKERLIDTAAPVQEVKTENEGAG